MISSINSTTATPKISIQSSLKNQTFKGKGTSNTKVFFDSAGQFIAKLFDAKNIFKVSDISNPKIGSAIMLQPNDKEFKKLKILIKDGTSISAQDLAITVDKNKLANPSFKGNVYGSIGKHTFPFNMKKAYRDFFAKGMYEKVVSETDATKNLYKNDYNFFVPTDGNGTRFKDYTELQGKTCKPAAILPATLNGHPLKLIQVTLMNFAKTGLLKKGPKFINVEGGKGSAFAFLEGLKRGEVPTNKPIVFCWGDNFSDINLKSLIHYHEENKAGLTVLGTPVTKDRIKSLGAIHLSQQKNLEILGFKEKPTEDVDIIKSLIPNTKDKYLASVGPFVISPEVLKWIKTNYSKNPDLFKNTKAEFDFSDCILSKMVKILQDKTISSETGEKLPMIAYVKPDAERWSDLGKTTELIQEMHAVKAGKYPGFIKEVQQSISENIDENGVIFQDKETKELFTKFCQKYGIKLENPQIVVFGK